MIRLDSFEEKHFSNLIKWIPSEKELYLWAGSLFRFPLTNDQLLKYRQIKDSRLYSIYDVETGGHIGHGEIGRIDMVDGQAALCRLLIGDKNMRGKGYGGALVEKLLSICFNELGLHKVSLNVADFNIAGVTCYEKAGFQIEGKMRDVKKVGNEYWSIYHMGILEEEYRKRTEK